MNEEVNTNEVSRDMEKDEEDTKKMIITIVRFSINEEVGSRKKIKKYIKEALVLKFEKGNNLRIKKKKQPCGKKLRSRRENI